jgi:anthranilate phosphoribosyltransferase
LITFSEALQELERSGFPEPGLVARAFDALLAGTWNSTQIGAFLVALRLHGTTAPIVLSAARSLRDHMVPLSHDRVTTLDTCGTGGDGLGSLNLSTGAAIIAAAAGAPVAKHGNRAVSSKSGSADVLEALGVRVDLDPERASALFRETGLVFLFAPNHHPAMRHVAPVRRELGVRTLFNCIGPLASPARVTHQLLGAYDDALRSVLASALVELGIVRAWVVRGEDGMDELSPFGPSRITVVEGGKTNELTLSPEDFGLPRSSAGATAGGDARTNAGILLVVLSGAAHPARDALLLNAAGALCVYRGISPRDGLVLARSAVDDGSAMAKLQHWIQAGEAARA